MREIAKNIIEKAAGGDMAAFEQIYKEYSSSVYTIALGITRNRHDAEEAAQDVFIKVHRALKDFRFDSSFGTWIYRITVNAALNACRAGLRRGPTLPYDEAADNRQPEPGAAGRELSRDAEAIVSKLLDKMTPEHRLCIVLREIEGFDYKEMAETLKIPVNTVRSRLKRAREALVSRCRKEGICREM